MKVVALLEDNQIRWLSAPLQIKSPVQVILEIPDEAITTPVYQEVVSPAERLARILGEDFKSNTEIAEFQCLTEALFGEGYCYIPEKSDQEILGDILSEKYA